MKTGHQAEELSVELPAAPASVTEGRRAAAAWARCLGADGSAVELAVAEAVGNAVVHGYPDSGSGTISVTGRREGRELAITVRDDGVGMKPNPAGSGLGMGLAMIGQLSDSFAVSNHERGGTVIVMRFSAEETARHS